MADFSIDWTFAGKGGAFKTMNVTNPCEAAKRGLKEMGNHSSLKPIDGEGDLRVTWSLQGGKGGAVDILNADDVRSALKEVGKSLIATYCGDAVGAISGGETMNDISNPVGWTIGKVPKKTIDEIRFCLEKGAVPPYTFNVGKNLGLSERDVAGVISYLGSKGVLAKMSKVDRKLYSEWLHGKAEVGEVVPSSDIEVGEVGLNSMTELNKICGQLQKGEPASVPDIIAYLHWYFDVHMKWAEFNDDVRCGSIAIDELEKFLSRGEVGAVGAAIVTIAGKPVAKEVYEVLKKKGLLPTIEKEVRRDVRAR